jgi:hypothetical protein
MKIVRKLYFVSGALITGIILFAGVTAVAPDDPRTILYEVFHDFAASYANKFFGDKFFYAHLHLVDGLAAIVHGIFLAVLIFLAALAAPKLTVRRALLILAVLTVVDIAFLVWIFPDPYGARYQDWLYR